MQLIKLFLRGTSVLAILALIGVHSANAGLVYWQNFEGGNGTADVGTGDLGITNNASPAGNTAFSSTGGVFGGSYNATTNVTSNNSVASNGIASSGAAGGTALSALPNSGSLSQFTISFWFKTETVAATSGRPGRLLVLGATGTTDLQQNNSFGLLQIATGAALGPTKIAPLFGTNDVTSAAGIGANNNLNEWTFVAVSYDGTSSFGNDSSAQNAATGSSINGQFYRGTDTASVVRTDLPISAVPGDATSASMGALNVGTSAILFLANRTALTRAYDGTIDDVRIYDGVLSADDIESVRQAGLLGLQAVPEPSTYALMGLGLIGLCQLRKRRQK